MRKIKEVLRLKWVSHLSNRAIARSCRLSHSTVSEYLQRASTAGLRWPLPEDLDEKSLYERLYPEGQATSRKVIQAVPDWEHTHQELKKRNVTLRLLWVEYREAHPEGYGYSQYCELYRRYLKQLDPPMRLHHRAGEKLFVDYAGDTIPVSDPAYKDLRSAQIFVAVLGASNYTYAEAQPRQELVHWIGGHVRAFTYFGGVPEIVVPDNLKQGVNHPSWYEPDLNPTYQELAQHYDLAVIPARVKHPRDKAKVEVGVQVVERWILARLRNQTFVSLVGVNRAVAELLQELNQKPMEHLEKSRKQLFEELDRPALRPLPPRPYEYAIWKTARVNIDYHVEFEKHFYSVPFELIHQEVRIRASEHFIEIFHQSKPQAVALHPRSRTPGQYSTQIAHMPTKHQQFLEWNPERLLHWAEEIGPQTHQLIHALLASRQHPEQAFRSCLGILNFSHQYLPDQLETACQFALQARTLNYQGVKAFLEHQSPADEKPARLHENIRGHSYYH